MREYVLLTGAASDIGAAIAEELSHEYNLILLDLAPESLQKVKDICDPNADIRILEMDLSVGDEIESILGQWLVQEGIFVSKFVHCVGVAKRVPLKMLKEEYFLKAFSVNVISAAMIIKVLASRKNKKKLDSVVLTASTSASRGVKTFSVYGAAKAAVTGLVYNLAMELAPEVRVNSISPGAIRTKATQSMMDMRIDEIERKYPLGLGLPENLSGVVRFLLSDKSKWITGQNLVVDGGRTVDGQD